MRINAQSKLTSEDVWNAVITARNEHDQDIHIQDLKVGTKGAIQFWCESLNGKYAIGRNDSAGHKAASWTAWGYVIAELFKRDPEARIGHYKNRDHFIEQCEDMANRRNQYQLRTDKGEDISFLHYAY